MNYSIIIPMGDMKTSAAPSVLETMGVGSCIAVIIYDPVACIGGMAHAILPEEGSDKQLATAFRYVDSSINALLAALIAAGARRDRLVAKLVGGAHMFSLFGDAGHGIGAQNIQKSREVLAHLQIPILAEETGGTVGRSVRFDLASGVCSVETHM
jgi:chemotaxis protein CheD